MRFFKWLGTGLKIGAKAAPIVLAAVNPPIGGIVNGVLTAVVNAEAKHGAGNGEAKRNDATQAVLTFVPMLVPMIEAQIGDVIDDEKFVSALGKLIDAIVDLMNAFKQFPQAEKKQ